jgi:hypothetical protein
MPWYIVHHGRTPGVYSNWHDAHAEVDKFKGACHKKYQTEQEAYAAFYGRQDVLRPPPLEPAAPPLEPTAPDKKVRQSAFDVLHVIILAQALVISFLVWIIWKLM